MIHYFKVFQKLTIPAAGSAQVDFANQNQPFEALTFWAKVMSAGNVDITPNLDGVAIVAKKIVGISTTLPQSIILDGVFPPSAPVVASAPAGFVPGLLVENKGASPIVVLVHILARSCGPQ